MDQTSIEKLAKDLNLETGHIQAAGLSDEQTSRIQSDISKSKKLNKWLIKPAAALSVAGMCALPFVGGNRDFKSVPVPFTVIFATAVLGLAAGRPLDKKDDAREEVLSAAHQNMMKVYKRQTLDQ